MDRRTFLRRTTALTAVGTAALAGCTGDEEPSDTASSNANSGGSGGSQSKETATKRQTKEPTPRVTKTQSQPTLEILSHEKFSGDFSSGVKGTVINNGDETVEYAEVEAKFFKDNTRVGSWFDNVTELGAGTKWNFKVMYLGDADFSEVEYKLEVSTQPF